MYRSLDPDKIIATLGRLRNRIRERFPQAGLSGVADELVTIAQDVVVRSTWIAKPNLSLRIASGLLVVLLACVLFQVGLTLKVSVQVDRISELLQAVDAGMNTIVLIGAAIFFLFTLEARLKRQRALKVIHELRVLAHIIDMHQLDKDPERLANPQLDTASSPKRRMTPFEMSRYLDYCSEMLSLIGKLAALHVQRFDDPVVLNAVDEVENLTTGLSGKIWQKITLIDKVPE
jgi:hypothetical protein